jgi:hypothetical protein
MLEGKLKYVEGRGLPCKSKMENILTANTISVSSKAQMN